MKIIVDADSCPFKEEVVEIASEFNVRVVMVLSVSHYYLDDNEKIEFIVVDNVSQEADMKIFNITLPGDLVVTGDTGLASLILSKNAFAISYRGKRFDAHSIDYLLAKRHDEAKLRLAGKKTKGPSKITLEDKERFCFLLRDLLSNCSGHE